MKIRTIDDLRDLKYAVLEMNRNHLKTHNHDKERCFRCAKIEFLNQTIKDHQTRRREWLKTCRERDKAEMNRIAQRVYNLEKRLKVKP